MKRCLDVAAVEVARGSPTGANAGDGIGLGQTRSSSEVRVDAYGAELRASLGISDGLLRLSVGCEDASDVIADLDKALS